MRGSSGDAAIDLISNSKKRKRQASGFHSNLRKIPDADA
jgi:hypothetical protein